MAVFQTTDSEFSPDNHPANPVWILIRNFLRRLATRRDVERSTKQAPKDPSSARSTVRSLSPMPLSTDIATDLSLRAMVYTKTR